MQQQILSRGSLAELIQRPSLDLYRKERPSYPLEDVIQDMRSKAIQNPAGGSLPAGQGRVASAFTISFSYPDRFKAQAGGARTGDQVHGEHNVTVQRNRPIPPPTS